MPSALETLVKILKLEREQGYKNSAVIGGLGAFSDKWTADAYAQAKRPEHKLLIDELHVLLRQYEATEDRNQRQSSISYMLDRITGRVPPPPEYQPPPEPETAAEETAAVDETSDRTAEQRRDRGAQNEGQRRDRQPEREARRSQKSGGRNQPQGKQQQGRKPDRESGSGGDFTADGDAFDFSGANGGSGTITLDLPPAPRLARPPRKPRKPLDLEQAEAVLREINQPVGTLKGVGPQRVEQLARLGIHTIRDLLFYLPRRYDDYTTMLPIRRLPPNKTVTVVGTVKQAEVRIGKGNRRDYYILVDDGSGLLSVTFFGQGWLGNQIRPGMQIVLRGATEIYRDRLQMTNPEWERVDVDNLVKPAIVPVYTLTDGLSAGQFRKLVRTAVERYADRLPDFTPEATLERADLAELGWTIRNLHFPESFDHLNHAKRRFIFDQLLILQLAVLGQRREWQSTPSVRLTVDDDWLEAFLTAAFPYTLTGAQQRAIADIRADIAREVPMNRLLQGDVGSGKTAVAITALAMAFANGRQAAIMAPTGILAEQHYRNIEKTLRSMPGERLPVVALLTSKLTNSEREAVYRGIADGSIDIVVGTHAIIQEGVQFNDLALAIIDEQHRFGVEQRGALRGKGTNPHLLVMTATPIPRTLALTLYADLDLSIIDEMPPGRIPIQTRVIEPHQRERAYNFVEGQLERGRQAFIVYPLVEASDKVEAESAIEAFEKLKQVFYEYRVGLLHGRMKPAEKDEIMAAFANKEFDVMVTTSVAEVGVDIPNASVIMIEGANRFGLAQLHQFRGRVGRGGHASYCLLVCDTNVDQARERLAALEQTNDGFKLAEIDWKLRGPGDLVGTRQSGTALLQFAEDMKPELVELAQREARTIYEEDPELQAEAHQLLRRRVMAARDERSDLS
ncbi:MAG: ATP-dependent DNA helicase RecG [Chloroflexota bacterium]|nr:MAG: DNA helicase RecG [Chloroflexota bacterium]